MPARSVVSFTYAHAWYTEAARDLSPAALEEAVLWRDAWRDEHTRSRTAAVGQLSATRLREIHGGLHAWRQREARVFVGRQVLGYAILLYGLYSFVSGRRGRGDPRAHAADEPGTAEARPRKGRKKTR